MIKKIKKRYLLLCIICLGLTQTSIGMMNNTLTDHDLLIPVEFFAPFLGLWISYTYWKLAVKKQDFNTFFLVINLFWIIILAGEYLLLSSYFPTDHTNPIQFKLVLYYIVYFAIIVYVGTYFYMKKSEPSI